MKKIITLVLALSLLTACGGKDNNSTPSGNSGGNNGTPPANSSTTTPPATQGANNNGDDADTLTNTNWQQVIKDVYGFDLTVPSGWTFKEGKKQNINPAYSVQFTLNDGDFAASYKAFAQHVFDLTDALSDGGNFKSTGSPDYNVAEKLTEIPSVYGIISPLWCFEAPKYTIQVDISKDEAQKIAQIYLVAVKSGN
jgi:major membrane immunogen (membrane-anchored lipoprotein)